MTEKYERISPFRVMVNQAGYFPEQNKTAILPFACEVFQVLDEAGTICMEGKPRYFGPDKDSGDEVYVADFSELRQPGKYSIQAGGETSAVFEISPEAYDKLFKDLMKAYYYLRCGCGLEERYAGRFVHDKCHIRNAVLWEERSTVLEVNGGWHDAGDYGRYITAGACALGHLLYAWQMVPETLGKVSLNIPESGGGVPDILSECRYELEWFLKMQAPDGGVYHKLTTAMHAPFVMPEEDLEQLFVFPVSSIATADYAAVCALAAEIYRKYDKEFAERLERAAHRAYDWLRENPQFTGFENPKECNTGEYGEKNDASNRFWAAAQMFALTGEETYEQDMRRLLERRFPHTAMGYGEIAGLGALGYLLCRWEKAADIKDGLLEDIRMEAERLCALSDKCGYGVAMYSRDYCWGSNMNVMKNAMVLVAADYFLGGKKYREYAAKQLHYLMGTNALGISYVTGNGDFCCNYPHLRPSDQDGIEECIPGMVSGGPNRHPADETAVRLIPQGTPPMKCYADHVDCYSLNEITIYWNSPAVFTLAYLLTVR
ncbi:MAG: glycoside hydrolase family 9 protein [Roseburia sp.]|nr:glycoside hydrolase family 9 protein [Roseburia sp.]